MHNLSNNQKHGWETVARITQEILGMGSGKEAILKQNQVFIFCVGYKVKFSVPDYINSKHTTGGSEELQVMAIQHKHAH